MGRPDQQFRQARRPARTAGTRHEYRRQRPTPFACKGGLMRCSRLLTLAALLSPFSLAALAAGSNLTIKVVDPHDAAVPAASVELLSGHRVVASGTTSATGEVRFSEAT